MPKASQNLETTNAEANQIEFAIKQWVKKNMHTAIPVQVEAVYPEKPGTVTEQERVGRLDVKLAIEQKDNEGKLVETKVLYNLPYFRYQGGHCAFVVDPKKGDWGWAIFCERDISKWKRQRVKDKPDTYRLFDQGDGIYVGGIRNDPPKMYVQIHEEKGVIINCGGKPFLLYNCEKADIEVKGQTNILCEDNIKIEAGASLSDQTGYRPPDSGSGSQSAASSRAGGGKNINCIANVVTMSNDCSIKSNCGIGQNCNVSEVVSCAQVDCAGVVNCSSVNTGGGGVSCGSMACSGAASCSSMECSGNSSCASSTCSGNSQCGSLSCDGAAECGSVSCAGDSTCGGNLSCAGGISCGGTSTPETGVFNAAKDFVIEGLGKLSELLGGGQR